MQLTEDEIALLSQAAAQDGVDVESCTPLETLADNLKKRGLLFAYCSHSTGAFPVAGAFWGTVWKATDQGRAISSAQPIAYQR